MYHLKLFNFFTKDPDPKFVRIRNIGDEDGERGVAGGGRRRRHRREGVGGGRRRQ